ncbi:MAG: heme ABC exporter ATP-binding protein CcmA [Caldilineaceae bacterium]|jgi:heme exporter protein A
MSDAALISVQGLHKRYGRKPILRGLNLTVEKGQVVALLGPNGAGKTTLMNVICGLAKPDRGEIVLGGASLKRAGHELRRYIGLVTHAPLLYDNLSAEENLRFFAKMYDLVDPDSRIESVLRAVDLWPRRRDAVRTYSRGMTQRLAIARAVLHSPPVLLLDEPDTGLDQESSEMLRDLVRQLGAADRAILLTTHNLERAVEWADAVCILAHGKISHWESTAELDSALLRQLYGSASVLQ